MGRDRNIYTGRHRRPGRRATALGAGALVLGLGALSGMTAGAASADPVSDVNSAISTFQKELRKAHGNLDQLSKAGDRALSQWLSAFDGRDISSLFTSVAPTGDTPGETLFNVGELLGTRSNGVGLVSVPDVRALGVSNVDAVGKTMGDLFEALGKYGDLDLGKVIEALGDPGKFADLISKALSKVVNNSESGFTPEDLTNLLGGLITPGEATDPVVDRDTPLDKETVDKVLSGIGPVVQKIMALGQKMLTGGTVTAGDFQDLVTSITDLLTNAGIDLGDLGPAGGDDDLSEEEQAKQDYEDLLNSTVSVTPPGGGEAKKMTVKELLDKLGVKYEQPSGNQPGPGNNGGTTKPENPSDGKPGKTDGKVTEASMKLSAGTAAPGDEITITGTGFSSKEKISFEFDNKATGESTTAADDGSFSGKIVIPADAKESSHKIGVTGEDSGRKGTMTVSVSKSTPVDDENEGDSDDTDDKDQGTDDEKQGGTDSTGGSGGGNQQVSTTTGGGSGTPSLDNSTGAVDSAQREASNTGGGSGGPVDGNSLTSTGDRAGVQGNVPADQVSHNAAAEDSLPVTGMSQKTTYGVVGVMAVLLVIAGYAVLARRRALAEGSEE